MKKLLLATAAASSLLLLSPDDAQASRRFQTHTSYPDKETEIFCKANPDKCERKINWGASIGGTLLGTAILSAFGAIARS